MTRRFPLLLALLALVGCASESRQYPSLALRPVEARSFDEPVRPIAVATADAALDADLTRQAAELDRIAAAFTGAADTARGRVDRAARAPVGSEAWLDAQAALAKLDEWRSQETALTATIEALGSARAAALQSPYPALDSLATRAAVEGQREQDTTERLQHALPGA